MGSCNSKLQREDIVRRCRARRRYMKELVQARRAFSTAHSLYLRSLRGTGSALLQFANAEAPLCHRRLPLHHHLPLPLSSPPDPPTPPPPPPPPPPLSSGSETCTSLTASPCLPPPPPPPPSSWDFWDPFSLSAPRSAPEDGWDPFLAEAPSFVSSCSKLSTTSDVAMVISGNRRDLSEIITELDEYFITAANSGSQVSVLLEASLSESPSSSHATRKGYHPFDWNGVLNAKSSSLSGHPCAVLGGNNSGRRVLNASHCSTIEKLYAWEKKLYQEVKNAESIRLECEKQIAQLRKLEAKAADYVKIERNKKEIERLESRLMVASQAMEAASSEIRRLREAELYPQLLDLLKGLMCMWRNMYECHQVQTHIIQQLKFLNDICSRSEPTSEIHRQATLQLELEVQHWHSTFCALVKSQRDYIHSLAGWLRLCLFQCHWDPVSKAKPTSAIYSLCEEWQVAVDRLPDKVASEGIRSFLNIIHAIVVQQAEEHKLKKKCDILCKQLDKKLARLRILENKYGPYDHVRNSSRPQFVFDEKRAKVEALRLKLDEGKSKFEKCSEVTRALTLNNIQTGLPNVFHAMTGFASVCMRAFEEVCNHSGKDAKHVHAIKQLK